MFENSVLDKLNVQNNLFDKSYRIKSMFYNIIIYKKCELKLVCSKIN